MPVDHVWSSVCVCLKPLSDPPHVALAVHHSFTSELDIVAISNNPPILTFYEVLIVWGQKNLAVDNDLDVMDSGDVHVMH